MSLWMYLLQKRREYKKFVSSQSSNRILCASTARATGVADGGSQIVWAIALTGESVCQLLQ